jgi:ribose 5-phosphate isomerase A
MTQQDADKKLAAAVAVAAIEDGMTVGLGSGSTSAAAVRLLAERIEREGLRIVGVPTSSATRKLALELGVPLADDLAEFQLDVAFDGADEATRNGWLIKGGGGALLQERIVAAAARRFMVMVDGAKIVDVLGKFPLPIEVFPLGWKNVQRRLDLRGDVRLRVGKDGHPFVTDQGNYILDVVFSSELYYQPHELAAALRATPGIADHGLFLDMANVLIIARDGQVEEVACQRIPV